jgi:hypothetical protein
MAKLMRHHEIDDSRGAMMTFQWNRVSLRTLQPPQRDLKVFTPASLGCTAIALGEHLNATETYLQRALKTQAQCRATPMKYRNFIFNF